MRTRVGNPFREAHGQPVRVYDWVAPAGTDPAAACLAAETALGVTLRGKQGDQHGYVTTSVRPDGAVYIAVCLYDFTCDDAACDKGEGAAVLRQAPAMPPAKLEALKMAIGEHARHKLTDANAPAILTALGFATAHDKLVARGSPAIETLDAHTARCAECGHVASTDAPLR